MKTTRIVDADDEDFDSLFATEEEKQGTVLHTEDGERLVYAGGNVWLAEPAAPMTEEEKAAYESRFSHPKISVRQTVLQLAIPPVRVYQVRAPMSVRGRCHMVPTCSDYMILAVRKYGALRGLIKGIKRLRRCDGMYHVDMP